MKVTLTEDVTSIEVDDRDVWSCDVTIAKLVAPLLIRLKQNKHGSPLVSNDDVPEHLQIESESMADVADHPNFHARWDHVIDEMIWTFSSYDMADEYDPVISARIANGLRLFAKYYGDLWD